MAGQGFGVPPGFDRGLLICSHSGCCSTNGNTPTNALSRPLLDSFVPFHHHVAVGPNVPAPWIGSFL